MTKVTNLSELYQTRIYKAWSNMKTRCNNPKFNEYHRYGGRGISYCKEWDRFESFYLDMVDGYSDTLTLDRIDNDKGYSKDNCRWATIEEQTNGRSTNRVITINGRTQTLAQWIRVSGLKSSTVRQRFYVYGWSAVKALGMEI